jgi:hypothetical protein
LFFKFEILESTVKEERMMVLSTFKKADSILIERYIKKADFSRHMTNLSLKSNIMADAIFHNSFIVEEVLKIMMRM